MSRESPSRPRDRAATEAALVAAARRVLLERGGSAVNVQTVAAAAGVDRKLVYRYFDGADGVVERVSDALNAELAAALDAAPAPDASAYGRFARDALTTWLAVLRAHPLALRFLAWELAEESPLLHRTEAARSAVLQAWMRDRRPRLRLPPEGDVVALTVVLMAAVQHLALTAGRGRFGGVDLDDAGWARLQTALDRLTAVWPD